MKKLMFILMLTFPSVLKAADLSTLQTAYDVFEKNYAAKIIVFFNLIIILFQLYKTNIYSTHSSICTENLSFKKTKTNFPLTKTLIFLL